jgi:hypothetical protein
MRMLVCYYLIALLYDQTSATCVAPAEAQHFRYALAIAWHAARSDQRWVGATRLAPTRHGTP